MYDYMKALQRKRFDQKPHPALDALGRSVSKRNCGGTWMPQTEETTAAVGRAERITG